MNDSHWWMKVLDIRVEYAKAQVLKGIDAEQFSEDVMMVLIDAEGLGVDDFRANRNCVPMLFKDVPKLVQAWKYGWKWGAESSEMENCSECQNDTGNPCSTHG